MKNQQKNIFILIMITGMAFFGCEGMAILFHGPKPEAPPVTYTVTFNANGADGAAPEAQTVNEGTIIVLPGKGGMSKGTDIFAGWNESASGGGTTYSVGASVTVTRNMVFYAQWLDGSTPQYTVTFNANGATSGVAPASQTVYSGISITIPGQGTLAFSGKTFDGWNTLANGGGTNYAEGAAYTVTGNITLYAIWKTNNNNGSGDIDSSLLGTWRDKPTNGEKMVIIFNTNSIIWGGSDGISNNIYNTSSDISNLVWVAKNNIISCSYRYMWLADITENLYDYRINGNGELEIKIYNLLVWGYIAPLVKD